MTPPDRKNIFPDLYKWKAVAANIFSNQSRTESSSKYESQRPHSSISSNSQSETTDVSDETNITSIYEPLLDLNLGLPRGDEFLHRIATQQQKDAIHMQSSTSLKKRLKWLVKDREDYKTYVRKITEGNDIIEKLVRARALSLFNAMGAKKVNEETSPSLSVQTVLTDKLRTALPPLPAEDQSSINVLTRLHGALVQSNVSDLTAKSQFGIKISLKPSLTRESLLEQFENLPFRADSQVHMLQALKPPSTNESIFLIAESPIELHTTQSTPQVLEEDLDPFIHIGDFSTVPSDVHRLYRDSTSWASVMSLQDLIGSSEKPPSPSIRFRLAAILATTHLHSSGLAYLPGQLNPESFKYFDVSSEAESIAIKELLEDEDRMLNLYYFSGIGSARPKTSTRTIGALRATTPTFDIAITELGLLLYQIGSWKLLECGNMSSATIRERLRGIVKDKFHELNRKAGMRYAETVEKCLEWRHQTAKDRQSGLLRLYQEVVKSLRSLDEEVRVGRPGVHLLYENS